MSALLLPMPTLPSIARFAIVHVTPRMTTAAPCRRGLRQMTTRGTTLHQQQLLQSQQHCLNEYLRTTILNRQHHCPRNPGSFKMFRRACCCLRHWHLRATELNRTLSVQGRAGNVHRLQNQRPAGSTLAATTVVRHAAATYNTTLGCQLLSYYSVIPVATVFLTSNLVTAFFQYSNLEN